MKQEFTCSGCGTTVLKYPSQLTRTDVVFCSLACRNKNYKRVVPAWQPSNKKVYQMTCQGCGQSFELSGERHTKTRKYCTKSCRAKHHPRPPHSEATKVKLSQRTAEQNKRYNPHFLYEGPKGQIQMRSLWEVLYAQYLDSRGESWNYEPKFKLSTGRLYLPDFQLSSGVIIEIKGYMRPDAEVKWRMFEAEYPELTKRLLRKEDLEKLGILT